MNSESKSGSKTQGHIICAMCVVFALLLLLSLAMFLVNPHHRIGDVAYNALFLLLGAPFAVLFSIGVFITAAIGKEMSRTYGIASALILGGSGMFCLCRSFSIFMSV